MKKYPYVAIKRVVDSKDRAVGFLFKDTNSKSKKFVKLYHKDIIKVPYLDMVDVKVSKRGFIYK